MFYCSFIRSVLEYADVVWDNCTKYEEDEVEKIQLEAARIVTGTTKLVSIDNLYSETGWETLKSRKQQHKLILFYKMVNNFTPIYLSSLLPHQVGNVSRYNLKIRISIKLVIVNLNCILILSCRRQYVSGI